MKVRPLVHMSRSPRLRRISLAVGLVLSLVMAGCGSSAPAADSVAESTAAVPTATSAPAEAEPTSAPAEPTAPPDPEPTTTPVDGAEPPANDLLANAIVVGPDDLPFSATIDTTQATSDSDDGDLGCPAPLTDASVWYSFTASSDMRITVGADGSDFPVGISAAAGEPGSLQLIECRPFAFEVAIEANTNYFFQVFDGDDPTSQGGSLVFSIEETSDTTQGLAPLSQEFVDAVARDLTVTNGAFMFAVVDAEGDVVAGSNGTDPNGDAPTGTDVFRIGSITKVFTSVATLSLVDEGLVELDAMATDYVSRVTVPDDVTVRDLLRHRSGIFNYTDAPSFFGEVFVDPSREWTPEDILVTIADQPSQFEPGSEFGYSNSNYIILGVLIEEVTGQPYHQVMRERILDPVGLSSTYLAGFEDGPEPFHPYEHEGNTDYDYTSVASAAWSAGALVSSAGDLHQFFSALFDDQIIANDLVAEMLEGDEYGLGLILADADAGLYGHGGGIPGYSTYVRHSPELDGTGFWVTTDLSLNPSSADTKMIDGFVALAAD